jgi:hypothetical protein
MASIYAQSSATLVIMPEKGLLTLRKTTERDLRDCPHLVFDHKQAWSLWETLKGKGQNTSIQGAALSLYGEGLNEEGNYNAPIAAQVSAPAKRRDGSDYLRAIEWTPAQLRAFTPQVVQLEYGVFKGPALCAYLTAPFKRNGAAARVIPTITRIDVGSPEGKAIAAAHAATPQITRINRK